MKENRKRLDKKSRKGTFTTGIVAQNGEKECHLYFTGRNHAGENPFEYLTAIQKNSSDVFKNPCEWLPWNYQSRKATQAIA